VCVAAKELSGGPAVSGHHVPVPPPSSFCVSFPLCEKLFDRGPGPQDDGSFLFSFPTFLCRRDSGGMVSCCAGWDGDGFRAVSFFFSPLSLCQSSDVLLSHTSRDRRISGALFHLHQIFPEIQTHSGDRIIFVPGCFVFFFPFLGLLPLLSAPFSHRLGSPPHSTPPPPV